jgi:hypothetical protein
VNDETHLDRQKQSRMDNVTNGEGVHHWVGEKALCNLLLEQIQKSLNLLWDGPGQLIK